LFQSSLLFAVSEISWCVLIAVLPVVMQRHSKHINAESISVQPVCRRIAIELFMQGSNTASLQAVCWNQHDINHCHHYGKALSTSCPQAVHNSCAGHPQ
jgi:hypothetical protein